MSAVRVHSAAARSTNAHANRDAIPAWPVPDRDHEAGNYRR